MIVGDDANYSMRDNEDFVRSSKGHLPELWSKLVYLTITITILAPHAPCAQHSRLPDASPRPVHPLTKLV